MSPKIPIYAEVRTDAAGRQLNEDAVYNCAAVPAEKRTARGYLYIVADGTGGQEGGQTASTMATTIIAERFYDDTNPDIGESLRQAVQTAHEALYELAQRVPSWAEMSTTVVAAVLHEGHLYVAHVGDSRAYLVRNGQARLLTRDHVWLQDDENYGSLTRWLGGSRSRSVEVDLVTETLQENDTVVLCSDGLTDVVGREDIQALAPKGTPQVAARQLIELANRRGTGDNVSVAVIRYGGKGAGTPAWVRWAAVGAGGLVLLGAIVALALLRPHGSEGGGSSASTPTRPSRIEGVVAPPTPTPTVWAISQPGEATRPPTSTPLPPTPTFTPRPTVRAAATPTAPAAVTTPPSPPSGGEQPPPPPPPPPPPGEQPPPSREG